MPSVTFTDYVSTGWGTKYSDVRVDYTENYTISTNTTRVEINGVYFRVQGDINWGTQVIKGRVKINGNTVCSFSPGSSTATQITVTGSYTKLNNGSGDFYYDIQHNSDGTGSFTLTLDEAENASISGIFGFWYSTLRKKIGIETTMSQTVTLTTRPRVSSVSATNANFGGTSTISITRYSSDFTHTVTATCAGRTEQVGSEKTSLTTLSWSPRVQDFAPYITNAMSATATISCSTYSGNTLIGTTTTTCTMSFTAASVAPSVSISYSDPMGYASTYGKYIKTKSKYAITLSVTLQYGASRSSGSVTANGSTYSYTGSTITTGVISSTSNTSITASITDSRGQTANASVTGIQIFDYSPPSITSISANRCDSSGTPNNTGGYYKINLSWSVTSLGSQNAKTLTPADKKVTQSTYTNKTAITPASYTATGTAPASGVYTADINSSYDIKVVLSDAFGSVTAYTSLPTSETRMNWGQGQNGGVAIGKVSEYDKTFEIASGWDIKFHTPLPIASGGHAATTQTQALLNLQAYDLNLGTAISANADLNTYTTPGTYYCSANATAATLTNCPTTKAFKMVVERIISSTYIKQTLTIYNGDSVYTRRKSSSTAWGDWLSNLLAAWPVGSIYMSVNSTSPATLFGGTWVQLKDRFLLGAGSTYSNGATGGEATHTLTVDEMPAHTHKSQGYWQTPDSGGHNAIARTTVSTDPTDTNSLKNTGGGGAHNNMPPYLVVYMWKRTV